VQGGADELPWAERVLPRVVAWAIALTSVIGGAGLLVSGWDYYRLPLHEQALHPQDPTLRSSGSVGLALGLGAGGLMALNALYLVRRNLPAQVPLIGTPRSWMTIHVVTGVTVPLVALLHAAFTLRTPLGVGALVLCGVVVLAGLVGRYLYSVVPRGASGRELELTQVQATAERLLDELDAELERNPDAAELVHAVLQETGPTRADRWIGARIWGLVVTDLRRRRRLARLPGAGTGRRRLYRLVARVLHIRRQTARHAELHRLMGTWRGLHRWLALALACFLLAHVWVAVRYADL
jgi:hypothetical protein